MTVFETTSAAETIELGRTLSSYLKPGTVVAFHGDLGAGKTTIIKGICAGLGVTETVKSPSFVIATEYRGSIAVYHIDLYRLDERSDFDAFGLDSYLSGDGVCLIEWAERAAKVLPVTAVRLRMTVTDAGRRIEVENLPGLGQVG
jgi:tRNA threonylcarbamoyladenosine biosynthesis protein TsaE